MPADTSASELSISLGGQLLLASPTLSDGTFDRAVIILAEHSSNKGALGIIINHLSEVTVGDLVPDLGLTALASLPVHHGGPLSIDELTFSTFVWKDKRGLEFVPRVSAKEAESKIGKEGHIVHATIGHSAWSPGQLENEIQRNTWIALKATNMLLSERHELPLWNSLLRKISPYHDLLSYAPQNPLLN